MIDIILKCLLCPFLLHLPIQLLELSQKLFFTYDSLFEQEFPRGFAMVAPFKITCEMYCVLLTSAFPDAP